MNLEKDFGSIKRKIRSSSVEDVINALEYVVTNDLKVIKERMESLGEKSVAEKTIWNEKVQVSLVRTSEIWGYMTLLKLLKPVLSNIK
jgi:hypothetical protein